MDDDYDEIVTRDNEVAEFHRLFLLETLGNCMAAIEIRGMAFQDEPWWPEFCALAEKLRKEKHGKQQPDGDRGRRA